MGVGHPGAPELVHRYVLQDFAKAERPWLEKMLEAVAEAFPLMAQGDDSRFVNKVLVLTQPPKPKPPRPDPSDAGAAPPEKKDT